MSFLITEDLASGYKLRVVFVLETMRSKF
jgi:hypothetical protein